MSIALKNEILDLFKKCERENKIVGLSDEARQFMWEIAVLQVEKPEQLIKNVLHDNKKSISSFDNEQLAICMERAALMKMVEDDPENKFRGRAERQRDRSELGVRSPVRNR